MPPTVSHSIPAKIAPRVHHQFLIKIFFRRPIMWKAHFCVICCWRCGGGKVKNVRKWDDQSLLKSLISCLKVPSLASTRGFLLRVWGERKSFAVFESNEILVWAVRYITTRQNVNEKADNLLSRLLFFFDFLSPPQPPSLWWWLKFLLTNEAKWWWEKKRKLLKKMIKLIIIEISMNNKKSWREEKFEHET